MVGDMIDIVKSFSSKNTAESAETLGRSTVVYDWAPDCTVLKVLTQHSDSKKYFMLIDHYGRGETDKPGCVLSVITSVL